MKDIYRISTILLVVWMASHDLVNATPRGSYRQEYSQVSYRRRSLQGGMDDMGKMVKSPEPSSSPTLSAQPSVSPAPSFYPTMSAQPSSTPSSAPSSAPSTAPTPSPTQQPSSAPSSYPTLSMAPSMSLAPTTSGFSVQSDTGTSTVSAVCATTFAASSTTALSKQVFQFQYYMYTNASKTLKIPEMDQRYVPPLAAQVLDCSSSKGDYDFSVQGIVATVHNGSEATTCTSLRDGTPCILAIGSFEALLKITNNNDDDDDTGNSRRLQINQDLSDPQLIIAFGGILGTLFAGTELLDEDITALAFDGFINGFSPGNDGNTDGAYPGIAGRSESATSNNHSGSDLALPIAASVVVVVVAMALLFVVMQRRKRRMAEAEGFHDLDSAGSWTIDPPSSKQDHFEDLQEQSVNTLMDRKQLEESIRPEFDFEVDNVSRLLGLRDANDLPSDEEYESDPPLAFPSYMKVQRRISPPHDNFDVQSTRSDLTPNTVDL